MKPVDTAPLTLAIWKSGEGRRSSGLGVAGRVMRRRLVACGPFGHRPRSRERRRFGAERKCVVASPGTPRMPNGQKGISENSLAMLEGPKGISVWAFHVLRVAN